MEKEPGIYHGLTDSEYDEIDAIRHSDLSSFADPKDNPSRAAANIGTCVHALALQGHAAALKTFRVTDEDFKLTTKEGKARMAELREKHGGLMVLRPKEADTVFSIVDALQSEQDDGCPELHPAGDDVREVVIVSRFEEGGPLYKGRLDFFGPVVRDLKTTHYLDADEQEKAGSLVKFRYHSQLAFYRRLAEQHIPLADEAEILWVSKREPYKRWIQVVDTDLLAAGWKHVEDLIRLRARYAGNERKEDNGS